MKIIGLCIEGFRRIKAVRMKLDPAGNAVFVTGKNSAGKTSVLDAIVAALGGGEMADHAIQAGRDRAEIRIDLGGLTVRKVIAAGQSPRLIVKTGDGLSGGQAALDAIVGAVGLDPVELAQIPAVEQAAKLRDALGLKLDFARIDGQASKIRQDREDLNRRIRDEEGILRAFRIPENAPTELVSVDDLLTKQAFAMSTNEANRAKRTFAADVRIREAGARRKVDELEDKIKDLQAATIRVQAEKLKAFDLAEALSIEADAAESYLAEAKDVDLEPISEAIRNAGAVNEVVQARRARDAKAKSIQDAKAKSATMTESLEGLKAERAKLCASRLPASLSGIAFDDVSGLTVNGLPLEDLGTGERLRVTTQVALALNPKLRVVLIRAGNDLDGDNLKAVIDASEAADAQVWIERIEKPADDADVVEIVDGEATLGDFKAEDEAAAIEAAKPKRTAKPRVDLFELDADGKRVGE